MIKGTTSLIAHIGHPTESFKAPMIYNPWFEAKGIDAVVVPMGVRAEDFAVAGPAIFGFTNFHGALITMPHKVSVVAMLAQVTAAVRVAGACNAVRRDANGRLVGDMFDGEGFVRGVARKGKAIKGARVYVLGCGGVGSAIAASFAAAGVAALTVKDAHPPSADALAGRLRENYPALAAVAGSDDVGGHDIVVNATPVGMNKADPLPMDVARLSPGTFVGEVVMKAEHTPFLEAALARGLQVQVGTDMLFEQIPAYLEFFGYGHSTPEELRALAKIVY